MKKVGVPFTPLRAPLSMSIKYAPIRRGDVGDEPVHVQAQVHGEREQVFRTEIVLISLNRVVHLPELYLAVRRLRRARGVHGRGCTCVNGKLRNTNRSSLVQVPAMLPIQCAPPQNGIRNPVFDQHHRRVWRPFTVVGCETGFSVSLVELIMCVLCSGDRESGRPGCRRHRDSRRPATDSSSG